MAREQIKDAALLSDVDRSIRAFKGHTGTRNFYCHATYRYDSELRLRSVHGITLSQEGEPLRATDKNFDAGTANEITNATIELAMLNRELWELVKRIESALGVRRVKMPQLPPLDPPP